MLFHKQEGTRRFLCTFAHTCGRFSIRCRRVMEGGADTGFRHVEPEKYPPRLLHFKQEGRKVKVTEVSAPEQPRKC